MSTNPQDTADLLEEAKQRLLRAIANDRGDATSFEKLARAYRSLDGGSQPTVVETSG